MKTFAFYAVVAALTVCVGAASQLPLPPQRPRVIFAPLTIVTADELPDAVAGRIQARGNVTIESGSTTITADEADIRQLNSSRDAVELSIDVRGRVHVSITPKAKN